MTRTTVYRGRPDDDGNETLADVFHETEYNHAVVIKTGGGQKLKIPADQWADIYIDGEEVDDD